MATLKRTGRTHEAEYSLYQLLKPEAIADPYPLYRKIREFEPVHWDPFLHSWVVTSYAECVTVLSRFKAGRTPTPEYLEAMGLSVLGPYAELMLKQVLFLDPPVHTRLRSACAIAFTPKKIEALRGTIDRIANELIDGVVERSEMELMSDFAGPFPAHVLAALMGLPQSDCIQLRVWANDMTELIGNFEHNPDRLQQLVKGVEELRLYLAAELAVQKKTPTEGFLSALLSSEVDGARLDDEEIVANAMLMIAGGLEEPSNLIACGMLSLLQRPEQMEQLRENAAIGASAVEELLRFESPTQQTGRVAPEDIELGGKQIRKGDLVTAVVAAANRDPQKFVDPDRLDLMRSDNRHLAFGWASHYCIGAPLARLTGQSAFRVLLNRLPAVRLSNSKTQWRGMASLRGIVSLRIEFNQP
jgi:pimeloyl-[acyl-carrier protein] synthase